MSFDLIRSLRCGSCRIGGAHLWEESIQSLWIVLLSVRSASLLAGPNSCWLGFSPTLISARSCCICLKLPIDSAGSYVDFQLATLEVGLDVVFLVQRHVLDAFTEQQTINNVPTTEQEVSAAKRSQGRHRRLAACMDHDDAIAFQSRVRQWKLTPTFPEVKADEVCQSRF